MFLNLYCYIFFIPIIIISSMMIFLVNSWFSQWMVMEINLIGFLSLMLFLKNLKSEIVMKYFLVQSFNSYIFLMLAMNLSNLNFLMSNIFIMLINLSMMTKMGVPPFYCWYIKIINNLDWLLIFLIITIQKIVPLIILNNLMNYMNILYNLSFNLIILTYSSFLIATIGIQMLNLKILMAYSSIIQMSWMILLMFLNETITLIYFISYLIILYSLICIFKEFNLLNLNNLNLMNLNKFWVLMFMMFLLMSLAGVPPFFGFMMKWISISCMENTYTYLLLLMMIINSLISMFFYMRIIYMSMVFYSLALKLMNLMMNFMNLSFSMKKLLMIWLSLMSLILYENF